MRKIDECQSGVKYNNLHNLFLIEYRNIVRPSEAFIYENYIDETISTYFSYLQAKPHFNNRITFEARFCKTDPFNAICSSVTNICDTHFPNKYEKTFFYPQF